MRIRFSKRDVLIGFILTVLFFGSRLVNLALIPLFTDEAIYLRWSQVAMNDSAWRFISLTDGKQPLFMWLVIPFMKLGLDPLVAGRLVSVFAGFAGMIGIFVLTYLLFRRKEAAFWASFLYLIIPFTLFYDRVALVDSLLTAFGIWILALQVLMARTLRLDVAMILGLVSGLALLTKSPAVFFLYLLPFSAAFLSVERTHLRRKLLRWIGLLIVVVILSEAIYSILRLSPFFHIISQKDSTFVVGFGDIIRDPFVYVFGNLRALSDWWITYVTLPVFLLALVSLFFGKSFLRERFVLLIWCTAPLFASAFFAKIIYPRYLLFYTPYLLVLAARMLMIGRSYIPGKILQYLVGFFVFSYALYSSFLILFNPVRAVIPGADKGQFVDDWPAGWGVREIVTRLKGEAQKGHITVYTEGTFGLMPFSLELYLVDNPNITIKGLWPVTTISDEVLQRARLEPTYFVFNETEQIPASFPLELIAEYQKGGGYRHMRLFRVLP